MINSIVSHLIAVTSGFSAIENARDLQPVETKSDDLPALFVFRKSGRADRSTGDIKVTQRQYIIVSIYLVCAADEHDTNERKLFDAMLGLQLDANHTSFEYIEDEAVSVTGKVVWHEYQFITWTTIREQL